MHYISQVTIDMKDKNTMEAVRNPYLFHGAIEKAVDTAGRQEKGRTLWRRDGNRILFVSETRPDLKGMEDQFGGAGQTKEYTLPDHVENGDRMFFRLLANPARTVNITDKKTGEIIRRARLVSRTVDDQMSWLQDQAGHGGFALEDGGVFIVRSFRQSVFRHRDEAPVQFLAVQYEGYLAVTDADAFRETIFRGLGREKAFGCGMLSIIRGGNHA